MIDKMVAEMASVVGKELQSCNCVVSFVKQSCLVPTLEDMP